MALLWSVLMASASLQPITFAVDKSVPAWVEEVWETSAPKLQAAYAVQFGADAAPVRLIAGAIEPVQQRRDLRAFTEASEIHIQLSGTGWGRETGAARRTVEQNLAHELAHIWQQSLGDTALQAWWVHEGFAEALSLDALAQSGLWPTGQVVAYRASLDAACDAALREGPLTDAFAAEDRTASYACGFVLIDTVAARTGVDAAALYERLVDAEGDFLGLADAATPTTLGLAVRAFMATDFSQTRAVGIVSSFRSGRL